MAFGQLICRSNGGFIRGTSHRFAGRDLPAFRPQSLISIQGFGSQDDAKSADRSTLEKTKAKAAKATSKFRELISKYGVVAVTTYFSIYGATLTSMFLLFDFNVLPSTVFGYSAQDALLKVRVHV